ncbi:hypothetical protein SUGI_0379940 [Cryptomeria japonica]|nr:hypothetical protein SUGI_0379940 [Cryptomeria japonica]
MKMALVFLLLLFLSALPVYSSHSSPSYQSDEEALLAFKHSLSLDSQNSLFDWSPHHSFCNWTGILCSSRHQRVVSLNLMGRWLYPEGGDECRLNLTDRLRIAKEIAEGMEYLHHHCFVQVIHCDLKPNNVLLGDDMTPYIADFGITKLLFGNSMSSLTSTNALRGSIGYIAPEYGMGGKVAIEGDVYSYGILLLELLTRRRPTDDMFVEGINLPKWVGIDFPNKIPEVVDTNLIGDVDEADLPMVFSCLNQLMQVGLACTRELPQQRPNMMAIVKRLEKITVEFLSARSFQLPIDIEPFLQNANDRRKNENWSTSTSTS